MRSSKSKQRRRKERKERQQMWAAKGRCPPNERGPAASASGGGEDREPEAVDSMRYVTPRAPSPDGPELDTGWEDSGTF